MCENELLIDIAIRCVTLNPVPEQVEQWKLAFHYVTFSDFYVILYYALAVIFLGVIQLTKENGNFKFIPQDTACSDPGNNWYLNL